MEQQLFEKYSPLDDAIVKCASKCELYLIGGTAIEIWTRKLGTKNWRNRSNNDLDFWSSQKNKKNIQTFIAWLIYNNFKITNDEYMITARHNTKNIDIDILLDYNHAAKIYATKIDYINIMSPVYLFISKFNRYTNSNNITRKQTDKNDLVALIHIIEKLQLEDALEYALNKENYNTREEQQINEIITLANRE